MKTVVVTGASHGIGESIALKFAKKAGARVVLAARTKEKLDRVADACRTAGGEAHVFPSDLTNETDVASFADACLSAWGAPDVLVNNAGLFQPGALRETSYEAFKEQIDANLMSAFLVTSAFLDAMAERGRGDIFYMCSVASLKAYPGGVAYCAAKHGLLGLARSVREETRESGLRVIALMPGATRTPSWDGSHLPDERFMPVEDIAETVWTAHKLTGRSVIEEIVIRPQLGDI